MKAVVIQLSDRSAAAFVTCSALAAWSLVASTWQAGAKVVVVVD